MPVFAFYDSEGRIESMFTASSKERAEMQKVPFVECEPSTSDATHYIDLSSQPPLVRKKKPLNTEHYIQGLLVTFRSVPVGTEIRIGSAMIISDGRDDSVEFDVPDTYSVELAPPPQYLPQTLEVTVG